MEGVYELMRTINSVIENTAKLHPDTIPDAIKCRWLSELDGKIMRETMQKNEFKPYSFPEDGERELVVGEPYDNIYELYLIAMSDFFSGEMANYSASAILFEQAYSEFRKNYLRSNLPPKQNFIC